MGLMGKVGACTSGAFVVFGLLLIAPSTALAQRFDRDELAKKMPPGCTPNRDIDYLDAAGGWQMHGGVSRHEITCREQVPPAVWPHAEIPEPQWPPVQSVPHGLDLAQAQPELNDPITKAYFQHLCATEAGEWIFKKVNDPQPVSVINLRPREDRTFRNDLMFDMYWLEGRGIAYADLPVVSYDFKGEAVYQSPQSEAGLFQKGWDAANKTVWFNTDPPHQVALKDWDVFEQTKSPITFVERPPKPEERAKYGYAKLLRFEFEKVENLKTLKVRSGREVLISPRKQAPADCPPGDGYGNVPACRAATFAQKLIVTPTNESKARYGYIWREVLRTEHDLRLGITGDEFMVVDMKTGEPVALRRDFVHVYRIKPYHVRGTNSRIDIFGGGCPNYSTLQGGGFLRMAVGAAPYQRVPTLNDKKAAEAAASQKQ